MMGWKLVPHHPYTAYSPDLALSDFHLFRPLNESLGGLKFEHDQQHVLKFFHTTDKDFYAMGFRRIVERCVNLQGDYVEK